MSRGIGQAVQPTRRPIQGVRLFACLVLLCALAACGGHPSHHAARYDPSRYYPPPGPPSDPWGPYIREASERFSVPELWIRKVMRQESGGQEDVISWAGAMGLMQVMPDTYNGLRDRYGLGDDPFDPHNNILAGTAYLREMYDRFGAPGFLAAYNAGPNRVDRYLNNGTPLPEETVNYVAAIAPQLGPGTPMSGPLAVYAGSSGYSPRMAARRSANGCDPDAAYNPDGPCTPVQPVVVAAAASVPASGPLVDCDPDAAYDPTRRCRPVPAAPVVVAAAAPAPAPVAELASASTECDPDAAYDPTRRCQPAPVMAAASPPAVLAQPLPPPPQPLPPPPPPQRFAAAPYGLRRPLQETTARPAMYTPSAQAGGYAAAGAWGIQVGAFASLSTAQAAAEAARMAAPDLLATAKTELPATTPFGSQVAFRSRLVGLSQPAAADACARLGRRGIACITVPPQRATF